MSAPRAARTAAWTSTAATTRPMPAPATWSATSTVVASFEAGTDGEDYIEGGGGNDVDLRRPRPGRHRRRLLRPLQPDRRRTTGLTATTCSSAVRARRLGRNDNGRRGRVGADACRLNRHARDADTMVGDNGRHHPDRRHQRRRRATPSAAIRREARYVRHLRLRQLRRAKLVVRGVHLLDYTPGGPDFRPDRFSLTSRHCTPVARDRRRLQLIFAIANPFGRNLDRPAGRHRRPRRGPRRDWATTPIYLGGGDDVAYGDADDDDIIGGWGNDWISGGTGRTASSATTAGSSPAATARTVRRAAVRRRAVPADRHLHREPHRAAAATYLNECIYTPGHVQTAIINVAGDLKKTVDLTPYNLTPERGWAATSRCSTPTTPTTSSSAAGRRLPARRRGRRRDRRRRGALERLHPAFDGRRRHRGAGRCVRSDWTRPFNAGDLLHFGAGLRRLARQRTRSSEPARRVLPLRRVRPAAHDPVRTPDGDWPNESGL